MRRSLSFVAQIVCAPEEHGAVTSIIFLQGIQYVCHQVDIFLKAFWIKWVLSVRALMIFEYFWNFIVESITYISRFCFLLRKHFWRFYRKSHQNSCSGLQSFPYEIHVYRNDFCFNQIRFLWRSIVKWKYTDNIGYHAFLSSRRSLQPPRENLSSWKKLETKKFITDISFLLGGGGGVFGLFWIQVRILNPIESGSIPDSDPDKQHFHLPTISS